MAKKEYLQRHHFINDYLKAISLADSQILFTIFFIYWLNERLGIDFERTNTVLFPKFRIMRDFAVSSNVPI